METPNNINKELNPKPGYRHQYNAKAFFANRYFKWMVIVLGELILLIFIFTLGISVGRHEERFTRAWMENYPRNFGGPQEFNVAFGKPGPFVQPHGLFGTILSKDEKTNTIVIKDRDNVEKTVIASDQTDIQKAFGSIKIEDLMVNDSVIIIGSPADNGQVTAKLIRVLN